MPDPALAALRDAERAAFAMLDNACLHLAQDARGLIPPAHRADWERYQEMVQAYRDAVAARAKAEERAALWASGTPVWVATDRDSGCWSFAHSLKPDSADGLHGVVSGYSMCLHAELTPPGTCVEGRIVLQEEPPRG